MRKQIDITRKSSPITVEISTPAQSETPPPEPEGSLEDRRGQFPLWAIALGVVVIILLAGAVYYFTQTTY